MTTHAVTAKRIDPNTGELTHVMWGQVNRDGSQWTIEPRIGTVLEVVDALTFGDTVVTVFEIEGGRVPGPHLRVTVDGHGRESIAIEPAELKAGRTIVDLPDC
ncbi:hypothetical protein [Cupriavidus sp. RAF12]|uniref:hypothetical protein n=1 Tax=Cupriavidus sp. RAF12 TaxID=3233050 RepID=UPI003F92179F